MSCSPISSNSSSSPVDLLSAIYDDEEENDEKSADSTIGGDESDGSGYKLPIFKRTNFDGSTSNGLTTGDRLRSKDGLKSNGLANNNGSRSNGLPNTN